MSHTSRKYWLTFPSRGEVSQPIIYRMSRAFPEVLFDIRQASVQENIGIMAVLLDGETESVEGAIKYLRDCGVQVDPIEKTVLEG